MKWLTGVIVVGMVILFLGCSRGPVGITARSNETAVDGNLSIVTNASVGIPPAVLSSPCLAGWKCISSMVKAYQLENCSFTNRETCKLGCANDTCRKPSICTPGFKCKGQYSRGYQLEDCSWTSTTKCEWGCVNAECKGQPNETSAEEPTAGESASAPATSILKLGQTVNVTVDGIGHPLRIYTFNEKYVQFELDGRKSDRLTPGESFTFSNGITVTLIEIYFQSYAGGKQEVEYRVG